MDDQLFSSQNSDLDNEPLDEIEKKAQAKNTKESNWVESEKVREMVREKKNFGRSHTVLVQRT